MDNKEDMVEIFMMTNGKYFRPQDKLSIRDLLLNSNNNHWIVISTLSFKSPLTMLAISFVAGSFGIDRFLLDYTMLGVFKLITFGACGIWTLIDFFLIMDLTREKNFEMIKDICYR